MPISSITGKPGNAKTAFLVDQMLNDAAENAKRIQRGEEPRPLFAAGVDGLKCDEIGVELLRDPKQWNAVKPGETCTCHDTENSAACNAHVIPNGAKIYIDEAWKWFGHLQDASRQPMPQYVLGLAEHRHRGIDMVWTYQQPNQIYPFARGLLAEHRHLVRKFGTMFCDAFDWQELNEDVKSQTKREAAQHSTVAIPKRTFGLYKSAEVHTIKRKLPLRVYVLPVIAVAAVVLGVMAYRWLRPASVAERTAEKLPAGAQATAAASQGATARFAYNTPEDYHRVTTPRVNDAPWTAPAFDGRSVVAEPALYCMASEAGRDASGKMVEGSCSCVTEQGTPYDRLGPETCRRVARDGQPYNPFKQPLQHEATTPPGRESGIPERESVASSDATQAAVAGSQPFGTLAQYGDIGVQ